MEMWQGALLLGAGVIAGFMNVIAGGGSLLTMPVMRFIGMGGPTANGSNRVAILAQNIAATWGFLRKGYSELRLSLTLTACALPGTVLGAYLGTKLEGKWFDRVLAVVMIGVMLLMMRRESSSDEENKEKEASETNGEGTAAKPPPIASSQAPEIERQRYIAGHVLMLAAGLYGGFIQAGVGFIMMAILHKVLGLDLVRVNMHKVFIVGAYTLVALGIFAAQGQVAWWTGGLLAIGNAAGGYIGSNVAITKGERFIRITLNIVLAIMAIRLLFG
jgi:hypothetical protein